MNYIHYGTTAFDRDRFKPVKNAMFVKPQHGTGFWASPVNSAFGWKAWCEAENFRDCKEENSFVFTLTDKANVFHIRKAADINKLPLINKFAYTVYIDFEKAVASGIDAIELHISDDTGSNLSQRLYYLLYGWDCDSILIMNPDIIQEVRI